MSDLFNVVDDAISTRKIMDLTVNYVPLLQMTVAKKKNGFNSYVVQDSGRTLYNVQVENEGSMANRLESYLEYLVDTNRLSFPFLQITPKKLFRQDGIPNTRSINVPARAADTVFLRSTINGVSAVEFYKDCNLFNAEKLFRTCPITLLFGTWFSMYPKNSEFKVSRGYSANLWGYDGVKTVIDWVKMDPFNVPTNAWKVYQSSSNPLGFTTDIKEADHETKGEIKVPILYGSNDTKGKPSTIGHGNVLTKDDTQAKTVFAFNRLVLSAVLSSNALSMIYVDGTNNTNSEINKTARVSLAALALIGHSGLTDSWRIRNNHELEMLDPDSQKIQIRHRGKVVNSLEYDVNAYINLYNESVERLNKLGYKYSTAPVEAVPSDSLVRDLNRENWDKAAIDTDTSK